MTIYQKIKSMNEDELGNLINTIYNAGHIDGEDNVDDGIWYSAYCLSKDETELSDPLFCDMEERHKANMSI